MKEAIDNLLKKHHGKKDMIKLVDQEYGAMVHNSCTDPNSMLHSTTRLHISQYVKHLAKPLNTSSSLNTSPEKLLQRQQLWYSGQRVVTLPLFRLWQWLHQSYIHLHLLWLKRLMRKLWRNLWGGSSNSNILNSRGSKQRLVLPVDSQNLGMRTMAPPSTSFISKVLLETSIVPQRFLKPTVEKDYQTQECHFRILWRQSSFKGNWVPQKSGSKREGNRNGKGLILITLVVCEDSAIWNWSRAQIVHIYIQVFLGSQGNIFTALLKPFQFTKVRAWSKRWPGNNFKTLLFMR